MLRTLHEVTTRMRVLGAEYMRVRMPVAHKGEWRPNGEQQAKQQKPPQGANSGKII
jgi:hypothetical protein